jgi:predicted esterase
MLHPFRALVFLAVLFSFSLIARAADDDDVADVPTRDITLAPNQRYLLHGDTKADEPKTLLLILPGGDGSADFQTFVKRIDKNAAPKNVLVAELVAVQSNDPKQIVWPTKKTPDPKQTFTTEEFIQKVVADVKSKHKIDAAKTAALGWSSSGPALYAASLTKDMPIKNWFIAMSVFSPSYLPPLNAAKGQNFYILHSPDDTVCPFVLAERASAQLAQHGARVTLVEYAGGHGWHGNVYGNIRAGLDWLAK